MIPFSLGVGLASSAVRSLSDGLAAGHVSRASAAVGPDFGAMLADVAGSAARSVSRAETVGSAGLQGKASARDVVDHLMQAEQNLQIALALRDKTVAAFQEISRMAI